MDMVANLRAFLAVARYGSFSEAARQLNVVPSVAAKRVTQLEHAVGAQLFERSTRKVALTEAGENFQGRARSLIAELDDTISGLRRAGDRLEGRILMMVPTTLHMLVLSDVLSASCASTSTSRMELALVNRSVNPAEEGFDLAITRPCGQQLRRRARRAAVPVRAGAVRIAGLPAAARHTAAAAGSRGSRRAVLQAAGRRLAFRQRTGAAQPWMCAPRLIADDNLTLRAAALAGNGIAMLPRYVAGDAIRAGQARANCCTTIRMPKSWFRAHVTQNRAKLARIVKLLEWLKVALAKQLPRVEA